MHKYTQLKLKELSNCFAIEQDDEAEELIESESSRMPYSGRMVSILKDVGYKYFNKLLDELFNAEKSALSRESSIPTDSYFEKLKKEFTDLAQEKYSHIRSKVRAFSNNKSSIPDLDYKEKSTRDSIERRVEMLKEELRLGIVEPHSGTTIKVAGDVGLINTGKVYGNIQLKIEKFRESNKTELAEAFKILINTIKDSKISDEIRREQMENMEFIVEQCESPPEKRKKGLIKTAERLFANAANLTSIWGKVGPTIMEYLDKITS